MNDKLQMVKLKAFSEKNIRGMKEYRGFGVKVTFGYYGGSTDFDIPPIYKTQDEAIAVARKVVKVMESANPEQVYIVEGFDGLSERQEFKRNKN